jgi:DNA-binding NarL/FixJ family response regulator
MNSKKKDIGKGLKILLVEDEIMLAESIVEFLTMKNYEVLHMPNGLDALVKIKNFEPHIVLCDIAMPVMDGFQLLKQVRANPKFNDIPFIFLTAKVEKQDFRWGMELGADDFITKPFTFEELERSIQSRLDRKNQILATLPSKSNKAVVTKLTPDERSSFSKLVALTKTEKLVFENIAKGKTTAQIAEEFYISPKTVENHRYNIMQKLHLEGTNSLLKFALKIKSEFA